MLDHRFGFAAVLSGLLSPLWAIAPKAASLNTKPTTLCYRARLVFADSTTPADIRFLLVQDPVAQTANRVKKPRLAPWHLEPLQVSGTLPTAMLLARLERLLYLSGPAPHMRPDAFTMNYQGQTCRTWRVDMPKGLEAYAFLVEIRPSMLGLAYLSGGFPQHDLQNVIIQLEQFSLGRQPAPAASGQKLLTTLENLSKPTSPQAPSEAMQVE